jgi:hypothetical protein
MNAPPDPVFERALARALAPQPGAEPPPGFAAAVMARLASKPPSPWFERGLALGAMAALAGATAWAAQLQPVVAEAWARVAAPPAAPVLAWAAAALVVQALVQARVQARVVRRLAGAPPRGAVAAPGGVR